jgi:hypothetical protein
MRRIAAHGLLVLALFATGCLQAGMNRGLSQVFSLGSDTTPGRAPSLEAAARVDQVGRQILAANPFTGGDISFQTVGSDEPAVFHRDAYSVFITDGLVNQCQTDGELAAVLCTELGQMVAERRNAARMGIPEPLPNVPTGTNSLEAGGIPADQVRLAELGMMEKKYPRKTAEQQRESYTDPHKLAVELLKTAGYDERELERAEPILRAANQNSMVVRQLAGPSAAPRWSK